MKVKVEEPGFFDKLSGNYNTVYLHDGAKTSQAQGGDRVDLFLGDYNKDEDKFEEVTGREMAHEAGHLMGAPDQYDEQEDAQGNRSTPPKKGHQNSIMADRRKSATSSDISFVIKDDETNDIDRD